MQANALLNCVFEIVTHFLFFPIQIDAINGIACKLLKEIASKTKENKATNRNYFENPLMQDEIQDLLQRVPAKSMKINTKLKIFFEKELALIKK